MKKQFLLIFLFVLLAGFVKAQNYVQYLEPPKPGGSPLSGAVRVGNMLYLSGQIGIDPKTGKLAEGGIEAETKQTLENIKALLERNGSGLDKIVKVTVFLTDMKEWSRMNAVYRTYFTNHFPARSAVGVNIDFRLEIECIAVIK